MVKTIHYCWFGNAPIPGNVRLYIQEWGKLMPDFQIIEWNEQNFDIHQCTFASQAYYFKKFAFVSDYVRMKVLYEYGGLYLDTDIKMLVSLTSLCENGDFIGVECDGCYGTGVMYAEPKSPWVKRMIDYYEHHSFVKCGGMLRTKPNTHILTDLYPNNSIGINILPFDFLTAKDWKTGEYNVSCNTYCIHDYAKTWIGKNERNYGPRFRLKNILKAAKWYLNRTLRLKTNQF